MLLALFAVATFLRRGDENRFRIGNGRKVVRPYPGRKSF
jgi:hypothetical protein